MKLNKDVKLSIKEHADELKTGGKMVEYRTVMRTLFEVLTEQEQEFVNATPHGSPVSSFYLAEELGVERRWGSSVCGRLVKLGFLERVSKETKSGKKHAGQYLYRRVSFD